MVTISKILVCSAPEVAPVGSASCGGPPPDAPAAAATAEALPRVGSADEGPQKPPPASAATVVGAPPTDAGCFVIEHCEVLDCDPKTTTKWAPQPPPPPQSSSVGKRAHHVTPREGKESLGVAGTKNEDRGKRRGLGGDEICPRPKRRALSPTPLRSRMAEYNSWKVRTWSERNDEARAARRSAELRRLYSAC